MKYDLFSAAMISAKHPLNCASKTDAVLPSETSWTPSSMQYQRVCKSQHLLFRYSCLQPPWLLKYFFGGKHLLLKKSLKTKKVFKKRILFSINRNLGSSDDDWIVTAAVKSLNKDTFQNYCVDCLIIQCCFVIVCARQASHFYLCLIHIHSLKQHTNTQTLNL